MSGRSRFSWMTLFAVLLIASVGTYLRHQSDHNRVGVPDTLPEVSGPALIATDKDYSRVHQSVVEVASISLPPLTFEPHFRKLELVDGDISFLEEITTEFELKFLEEELKYIQISSLSKNRYIIKIPRISEEKRALYISELETELSELESVQNGMTSVDQLLGLAERRFRHDLGTSNLGELERSIELTLIAPVSPKGNFAYDYKVRYDGGFREGNYLLPVADGPLFLVPYVEAIFGTEDE